MLDGWFEQGIACLQQKAVAVRHIIGELFIVGPNGLSRIGQHKLYGMLALAPGRSKREGGKYVVVNRRLVLTEAAILPIIVNGMFVTQAGSKLVALGKEGTILHKGSTVLFALLGAGSSHAKVVLRYPKVIVTVRKGVLHTQCNLAAEPGPLVLRPGHEQAAAHAVLCPKIAVVKFGTLLHRVVIATRVACKKVGVDTQLALAYFTRIIGIDCMLGAVFAATTQAVVQFVVGLTIGLYATVNSGPPIHFDSVSS